MLTGGVGRLLGHPSVSNVIVARKASAVRRATCFLGLAMGDGGPIMLMKTVHPSATLDTSNPLGLCGTMIATKTGRSVNGNILVTVGKLVLKTRDTVGVGAVSMRAFRTPGSNTLNCVFGKGMFCGRTPLGGRAARSIFSMAGLGSLPGMNVICDCSGVSPSVIAPLLRRSCGNVVRTKMKGNGFRGGVLPMLLRTHGGKVLIIHSSHMPANPAAVSTRMSSARCRFVTSRRLGPRGSHMLLVLKLAGAGS